ncbi:GNAT family N-acetyltransferase [Yoonia sp. 208BN28-4]|uniref:GNAT family N-acetyltransferase n=1 Tax=Yoonia sp. 208BN28-4 TaxID=3126505 RepID=UPI0030B1DB28
MTDHTTRPLTAADIPALKAILDATELFPSDMLEAMVAGYLDKVDHDLWLVSEAGGIVTGFAYSEPERMTDRTWNLLALAVSPDHQKRGIGATLIDATRAALKAKNVRMLMIETADILEFEGQRAFYQRMGLAQVAHIPEYYEAGVGKVSFAQQLN